MALGIHHRRGDETKGAPTGIRAEKKDVAAVTETRMMIRIVLVIVFPRRNELEFSERIVGPQEVAFARRVTVGDKKEVIAAARAFDVDAEAFVGFFEKQNASAWTSNALAAAI